MSFRLRFLIGLLRWFLGPSLDINKAYRQDYRVWPTEAEFSVVENARYGYLFVLERFRAIFATTLWKQCRRNGWTAVMGAQIYKVKRPLKRFQKFTITTQPVTWDEKWFYFEQRIHSEEKLIASAVISVIFLSLERKIPTQEVLASIGISRSSDPLSTAVQKFIAAESELAQN